MDNLHRNKQRKYSIPVFHRNSKKSYLKLGKFQRLRFFVCSVALGLPCEGTRDAIDVPSNKQKFLNKIARNHYTTTQNKPLIISESYHDNFRHQNRFKSLGCTWMIDQNRNFSNLDGIESGGLSAQCLVVDQDPLTETLSLVSCMRDQKINLDWGNCIQGLLYRKNRNDVSLFCFGYAQR